MFFVVLVGVGVLDEPFRNISFWGLSLEYR